MRNLFAAALLSVSLFACKPPVTEVQIPLVSSMQGKGYQEVVPLTELKISAGSETITAYLITPEMAIINATERLQAEGKGDLVEQYKTRETTKDTVVCQLRLLSVSKDSADPTKWKFSIKDDKGKTKDGTIVDKSVTPSKQVRASSGNLNYVQDGQVQFVGYRIEDAKKLSITMTAPGGKPVTLSWVIPADHVAQAPAASQPAASAPAAQ